MNVPILPLRESPALTQSLMGESFLPASGAGFELNPEAERLTVGEQFGCAPGEGPSCHLLLLRGGSGPSHGQRLD